MLKVVTFNIRCCDDPYGNSVAERAVRLEKIMQKYDADIIGFQEYTPIWEEHIHRIFGLDYNMFNKYRAENEREASPILWKKEKFNLEKTEYFWLSDTPEVESKGWDEVYDCYRMCVYAKLVEKSTGRKINFLNTHFGFGDKGQLKSVGLVSDFCKRFSSEPICIVGDFNMQPDSVGYSQITKQFCDTNAITSNDLRHTFHGYNPLGGDTEHIDYCFTNELLVPKKRHLIDDMVDGKFPSDHFGVLIEF